jgi:hypothetical protein
MAAPGQTYPALYASAQVGGVRGIYRSDDAGASWLRINDDQHQYGATSAAISGDPRVFGRVYVGTNGRGVIVGEPASGPSFSLSVTPPNASAAPGACATYTVTITRSGGFTAPITLSSTQPPGIGPITFNPATVTGTSSLVTVCVPATTPSGAFSFTITGSGGGLSRSASAGLTVTASGFTLAANPSSLSVARGASGTSTVTLTRTGGFTAAVALAASGLPAGVTASFNPASTTGNSAVLTLTASSTATLGAATVTVTGSGGGLTRTATLALTVTDPPSNPGVVITPVVTANGPWFNELAVRIDNTATITALSVTIVIQRTTGVGFSGQYNTVGGQILQSNSSTATAVTYQVTLASGQTLGAGTGRTFAAQASGQGTAHPTAGDTFTVTYTTGGQTFTQNGHF